MSKEHKFATAAEMLELKDLLEELLNVEAGLTEWEVNFIDSLSDWDGSFTANQAEKLRKVHERVTG